MDTCARPQLSCPTAISSKHICMQYGSQRLGGNSPQTFRTFWTCPERRCPFKRTLPRLWALLKLPTAQPSAWSGSLPAWVRSSHRNRRRGLPTGQHSHERRRRMQRDDSRKHSIVGVNSMRGHGLCCLLLFVCLCFLAFLSLCVGLCWCCWFWS